MRSQVTAEVFANQVICGSVMLVHFWWAQQTADNTLSVTSGTITIKYMPFGDYSDDMLKGR